MELDIYIILISQLFKHINMKKICLFVFIFVVSIFEINAQMAVNNNGAAPHASAILDIQASSTTNAKGVLMPRIPDHAVITNPAKGLMVFNTTTNSMWLHNGTGWNEVGNGSSGSGWILKNDTLYATNKTIGINTTLPKTTLEVQGNGFLVSQKISVTAADPNLRTINLPFNPFYSTLYTVLTEESGFIYDPSGPSAPYPSGVIDGTAIISPATANLAGIKLTFEAFDTEANGDSIIIYRRNSTFNAQDITVLAKYSGNTLPPDFFYSEKVLHVQFKTNGNNIVGQGFKIKWQRINTDANANATLTTNVVGNSMYFESTKGVLRSGNPGPFSNAPLGQNSVAIGYANRAVGNYSTAMGYYSYASSTASFAAGSNTRATGTMSTAFGTYTTASGEFSVALGASSEASGNFSFAAGNGPRALGESSVAMGYASRAGGVNAVAIGFATNAFGNGSVAMGFLARTTSGAQYATAMGYNTIASSTASFVAGENSIAAGYASTALGSNSIAGGDYSTAMGSNSRANLEGSFAIGDSPNGSNSVVSPNSNTFTTRFRNGYYLYSNANATIGVVLSGGGNSWSMISDSTKKENFLPIDGENVLKKIARMRTVTWNYKGQDPKFFRHYGPMAQEFFSAFGRDKLGVVGNDTTISSADFDGINFTAIKALEKRTAELQTENESLKKRLAILEKSNSEVITLKAEMEQLKALLLPEKEKISAKSVSNK